MRIDVTASAQSEEILKIAREKREVMEKLIALLDDREMELFADYRRAERELEDRIRYKALIGAMRFGLTYVSDDILLDEKS